ncbi:HVO_A0114 family putative DNA-binding protein [Halococcoides cellulosivorans]
MSWYRSPPPWPIDLLQAIAERESTNICEASRLVGRDIKQVSESLERLYQSILALYFAALALYVPQAS